MQLGIDQAGLVVNNLLSIPVQCSELSSNCYKVGVTCLYDPTLPSPPLLPLQCKPNPLGTLYPGETANIVVDTTFPVTYLFHSTNLNNSFK